MGYISKVVLRNNGQTSQTALIEPTLWGVCETEANRQVKIVSLTDFTLTQGVQITIRFLETNTADSPKLNINSTGERGIIHQGSAIAANTLVAGVNYQFVYNGTNYELISAAAQWAAAQTVYVNLANNSNNTTLQGGSSSAEVLGVNGILKIGNGGTGTDTHTLNRFVWSSTNNQSETILAAQGNHYIDNTSVAINYTSAPEANFYVFGQTIFSNDRLDDTTTGKYVQVGNMTSHYLSIGANGLQAYNIVNNQDTAGQLELQPSGGSLQIASASTTLTAALYGTYNLYTTDGFNYRGISESTTNDFTPIWFSKQGINSSTQEKQENTGVPVYNSGLTYNASTHFIQIYGGGLSSVDNTPLTIKSGNSLNLITTNSSPIVFKYQVNNTSTTLGSITSSGTFIVGNPAANSIPANTSLYVDGASYFNNNITVNGYIIPSGTQVLGTPQAPWSGIYVGSSSTYGNAFKPIYWNNGVPAEVSVVQKQSFTLQTNGSSITLHNTAYNSDTVVLSIVITDGGQYVQAPISVTADSGELLLSTSPVTGTVTGYVITARGVTLEEEGN